MKTTLCDTRAEQVPARFAEQASTQDAEMRRHHDAKRKSAKRTANLDSKADMDFVRCARDAEGYRRSRRFPAARQLEVLLSHERGPEISVKLA